MGDFWWQRTREDIWWKRLGCAIVVGTSMSTTLVLIGLAQWLVL